MVRKYFLPLVMLTLFVSAEFSIPLAGETPTSCYPLLNMVTNSIPTGTAGTSYSVGLAANGGQPPYAWSFGQSSLPQGFSISSNGSVTGTPTTSGTYAFNVIVSDALKNNVTGPLTLLVAANGSAPPVTTPPVTTPPVTTPPVTTPPVTTPPVTTPPVTTPPVTTPPVTSPGGQVATPTFSAASGAVAPGTAVTGSDSTSGATIYYTWSTNGTAPANPSYDSSTYMPAFGSQSFILGTAGTSGITAGNAFVPSIPIYGPMQIKMLAAQAGMQDSPVVSASYTLTAPKGRAVSACGALAGKNFLTTNVSSTGTCFSIQGANTTLNLNGYTITYGTGPSTLLSGTDGTVTSGSTAVSCTSCTFTPAMVGERFFCDNYNTGGYQNCADTFKIATYVDAHDITLNGTPGFSGSGIDYIVETPPTHGIDCDPSRYGTCTAAQAYNGTITQGSTASLGSSAIDVNPNAWGGASGPFVWANLNINISQPEALAINENATAGADLIANNTINSSVTQIYYRDGLQYPIKLNNGGQAGTTPVKTIENNTILGSPQGGIYLDYTANVFNNYINSGPTQYSNGFCEYAYSANSVLRGNTCVGNAQGMEMEGSAVIYQNNYNASTSSASVHDPNHNPIGCNLNYGIRFKDFGRNFNGKTPTIFNDVVDSNVFNENAGVCGGVDIEISVLLATDTVSITNNIVTESFPSLPPGGPSNPGNSSALYGTDNGETGDSNAGVVYNNNTLSRTGPYAANGYDFLILYDGANDWVVPQLNNPQILWWKGPSNVSLTLTGTGTPTCTAAAVTPAAFKATWNGAALSCP